MPNESVVRVLMVDDHALLGRGIAALVNAEPDMKLVAKATSGAEAIEKFRKYRPDVTLMDLQMEGMSGIEAIIGIRADFPNARIIVLTTYLNEKNLCRMANTCRVSVSSLVTPCYSETPNTFAASTGQGSSLAETPQSGARRHLRLTDNRQL